MQERAAKLRLCCRTLRRSWRSWRSSSSRSSRSSRTHSRRCSRSRGGARRSRTPRAAQRALSPTGRSVTQPSRLQACICMTCWHPSLVSITEQSQSRVWCPYVGGGLSVQYSPSGSRFRRCWQGIDVCFDTTASLHSEQSLTGLYEFRSGTRLLRVHALRGALVTWCSQTLSCRCSRLHK